MRLFSRRPPPPIAVAELTENDRREQREKALSEAVQKGHWGAYVNSVASLSDCGTCVRVAAGQVGYALYGPYIDLAGGEYVLGVTIDLLEEQKLGPDEVVAIIDITSGSGATIHGKSQVYRSHLALTRIIELCFRVASNVTEVEFRVAATGKAALSINLRRDLRVADGEGEYLPMLPAVSRPLPDIFSENVGALRGLHQNGCLFDQDDHGIVLSMHGVRFRLKALEDIQVTNEVFVNHDYAFAMPRDVIVLDVGMNVGLASLYFASQGCVKEVHSFEPFPKTFERALENLRLNPTISPKINPHLFGLSDTDRETEVQVTEGQTIGNSLRGLSEGTATSILVRDAAPVLRAICEKAEVHGLAVVVKLDCEGSEFAILQRWDDEGLLPKISAIMMEWHKWWSPELTAAHINDRLLRNGFIVFDKTRATEEHVAGHITAVRAAR